MDIVTTKDGATTRTGLPHTQTHLQLNPSRQQVPGNRWLMIVLYIKYIQGHRNNLGHFNIEI